MPIISVFYNTADIPMKYAARLFEFNRPTNVVVIKDTLEEIRKVIPSNLTRMERQSNDHPTVVEVWL
jgi:hypothetical protein